MGAEAIAILLAGLAAKAYANHEADSRAKEIQTAMEAYQRMRAQQNEAAINQTIDQQTPTKRADELKSLDASRVQSMQNTVDAARAASPVTAAAGTNTSQDYERASGAAADTVAARTKRAIEQLGMMGAPGEQSLASGIRFGRAAGTVDAGNAAIENVGRGYMRDIDNVRPDPFLSLLGDVGIAYGSAGAGAGGAVAGAAGSAAMTRRRRVNSAVGDGYSADGYNGGNTRYVDSSTNWQ